LRETRDCICPADLPECRCQHEPSLESVSRHPITPSESEIEKNPRSRSARLRVARKI
jgi:16S rRNA (cytosine1402-N4)-methyltransferase